MDQPGRLLALFKTIQSDPLSSAPSISGHPSVDTVLRTLAHIDLARLLKYVRLWNATAKTSGVAQLVLHAIIKLRPAEDIMRAFGNDGAAELGVTENDGKLSVTVAGKGEARGPTALKDWVEAVIPYTERHLARMDRLLQDSYVVDYLLGEMDDGMFDELDEQEEDFAGISAPMEVEVAA